MKGLSFSVVLACCTMILASCQADKKVIMNQQQLAQLTDQQIIQFNQQSCARQDRYEVLTSPSHALQLQLNQITQLLPKSINGKVLNYRVYLNTQPAAWASLNGCIRVTSGLLKTLNSNEVQAVIAHEIGHIALNHSINAFHAAKSAEIMSNGEIILLTPQSLSQRQELEADEFAIRLLRQTHIDPNGLITMMDKLNHHQKQTSYSHPDAIARKNILIEKTHSPSTN